MKKTLVFLFTSLLFMAVEAQAQQVNKLYAGNVSCMKNMSIDMPFYLDNTNPKVVGLQFEVSVPEGVTINTSSSNCKLDYTRVDDHQIRIASLGSRRYRVMMLSPTNQPVRANKGKVFTLSTTVAADAPLQEGETYPVTISNVVIGDSLATNVMTAYTNGSIKIEPSPDFTASDVAVTSGDVTPGGNILLSWNINNIGSRASNGGWSEIITLVSDATGETCSLPTMHYTTPLSAGSSVARTATVAVPKIVGISGSFKVQIKIVPNSDSGEGAEYQGNNTAVSAASYQMNNMLYFTLPSDRIIETNDVRNYTCMIERSGSRTEEQTFTITHGASDSRVTMPTAVTIPQGKPSARFDLTVTGDDIVGEEEVTLTYSIAAQHGYPSAEGQVVIEDNDYPTLSVKITDANGTEKESYAEGEDIRIEISSDLPVTKDVEVKLSTDKGERLADMPGSVTLGASQLKATVAFPITQDNIIHFEESATVTASATRFNQGQQTIMIADDDMPTLSMSISKDAIAESEGSRAARVTILRSGNMTPEVTFRLGQRMPDGSSCNQLFFPSNTVKLKKDKEKVEFYIGVLDDNQSQGSRDVVLTAAVYSKSCNCQAGAASAGLLEQTVNIVDNDGPHYMLTAANSNVLEGNDVTFTVNVNTTQHTQNIPLTVTCSKPSLVELPAPGTVVLPAGQTSVTFTARVKSNDVQGDTQQLKFKVQTVEGNGYASTWGRGSCIVMATDQTLPDAVVKGLRIISNIIQVNDSMVVEIDIENRGFATLKADSPVPIQYRFGNLKNNRYLERDVLQGAFITQRDTLPTLSVAGDYQLEAEIDVNRTIDEVDKSNNISEPVDFFMQPLFTVAEIATDKAAYVNDERVTVSGRATGLQYKNVDIEVYIINNSKRYKVKTKTDDTGNFMAEWTPTGNIAGHFAVGACAPGDKLTTELTSFEVYGMRRYDSGFLLKEMEENETAAEGFFEVYNHGLLPLHNIKVTIEGTPANATITTRTTKIASLGVQQHTRVYYTITGLTRSEGDDWQTATLHLQSDEGAVYDQPVYFFVHPSTPVLKANISKINTTMTPGKVIDYPITIRNEGRGETGEMVLDLGNLEWLRASTPVRMPSLKQFEEATIVLQLAPSSSMELNSITTGQLAINCPETDTGLMLPFRIETVSEDKGTLVIDVWDEFTSNNRANDGPHVEGATVNVLHPVTRQLLRQMETGSDGLATFEQLPCGNYIVAVTHPKHTSYQDNVMVTAGRTETYQAFISYSSITIEMKYEPTEIEDEYNIVTTMSYETNVPAPVVVMDMPDKIVVEEITTPYLFYVNLTNVGLIAAEKTRFSIAHEANGYTFTPLLEGPWRLLPQQTVTVPVEINKKEDDEEEGARQTGPMFLGSPLQAPEARKAPARRSLGGVTACGVAALAQFVNNCASGGSDAEIKQQVNRMMQIAEACSGGDGGGTGNGKFPMPPGGQGKPGGGGTPSQGQGHTGSGTSGGGGASVVHCDTDLQEHADDYFLDLLTKPFPSLKWVKIFKKGVFDDDWRGLYKEIFNKIGGKLWGKFLDKYGKDFKYQDLVAWIKGCYDFKKKIDNSTGNNSRQTDSYNDMMEEDSIGFSKPIMKSSFVSNMPISSEDNGGYFGDFSQEVGNYFRDMWKELERGRQRVSGLSSELDEPLYLTDRFYTKEKPADIGDMNHPEWYPSAMRVWEDNRVAPVYHYYHTLALMHEVYGNWSFLVLTNHQMEMLSDTLNTFINNPDKKFKSFYHDLPYVGNRFFELFAYNPMAHVYRRWKNTVLMMRGEELPEGADVDNYIHPEIITACCERLDQALTVINRAGYDDQGQMLNAENKKLEEYLSQPRSSVCSSVKLQLEQKLTMTRQAVRGTLTVHNGSDTQPMTDVKLKLTVTDPEGNVADSRIMQINTERKTGFTGEDDFESGWTLAAGGTGTAKILFIPTNNAAPEEPVQYTFAGTISFTDPFTGASMTRDLEVERLTVNPSPMLDLTYFLQRDILGDDPLTEGVVEPLIPSQFTLLVNNKGKGDATKVHMVTNQPEIIENEKGLMIDFQVESSQLNGGDKTLAMGQSVATDFGDIPSGKASLAQWWLTSSLTGHFTEYNVAATHATSYDSPDMSLIDQVSIHELIRQIELPGVANTSDGTTAPDHYAFLVNDEEDYHDYPDQLYTVDGSKLPVAEAAGAQWQQLDAAQWRMKVTATATGWNYGNTPDPTGGTHTVKRITRLSDNSEIPVVNFWQTDRTLVDGNEPKYENLIHYADMMPITGETYIVEFEPKEQGKLAVQQISGVPDGNSFIRDKVGTIDITFNTPVDDATFTTDDLTLMHQGKKLDLSGLTLVKVNEQTFRTDLTNLTTFLDPSNERQIQDGYYNLTVSTFGIRDADGIAGETSKSVGWTQTEDGKAMLTMLVEPEGAGTVTPGTSKQDFFAEVTLTAVPNTGCSFVGWRVDDKIVSTLPTVTYGMFGAQTITAVFQPLSVRVNAVYNENRGYVSGGNGMFDWGSEVKLKAEPNDGYYFDGWYSAWSKDAEGVEHYSGLLSSDPTYVFTVTDWTTCYARFEQEETVNVSLLEDNDDNTSAFDNPHGKLFVVTSDRLLKSWQWNPVCLPFSLSEQQINKLWGYATQILRLTSVVNGDMHFSYQHDIIAGVPYLLKPERTVTVPKWEFKGDNIKIAEEPVADGNGSYMFVGNYTTHDWNFSRPDNGIEYYYGVSSGKIIKAKTTTAALKGLRAYFVLPSGVSNARIFFDDIVTGISEEVSAEGIIGPTRIYSIQGQYMGDSLQGLPKGIYIINGKKQLVK